MPSEKLVLCTDYKAALKHCHIVFFCLFLFFFKHMKNILLGDK